MSVARGIGDPRHADLHLGLFKQGDVLSAGILHAAIGVESPGGELALFQGNSQGRHAQLGVDALGDRQPTILRECDLR